MNFKNKNDIENFWENKDNINFANAEIKKKILEVLESLDSGEIRVCEKKMESGLLTNG